MNVTKGLLEPTAVLQFSYFIPYRIAPACHPKVSADISKWPQKLAVI